MRIIDAQVHDPAPWLNWKNENADLQHTLLTELMLAYLDALGVEGVVLFPVDVDWAAGAAARDVPDRIAYVPTISPHAPDLDRWVAAARERHGAGQLGFRAVIGWPYDGAEITRLEAGDWEPVFAACEKHQVPLFLFIAGWLPLTEKIAERFPDLTIIIDHMGLPQPPLVAREEPPFKSLPDLIVLAKFPNVFVKLSGLPALSEESFPYKDVLPHLRSIVDAFGADRLMWGSDITMFYGRIGIGPSEFPHTNVSYPGRHTYAQSLHFIQYCDILSVDEKEAILGGTVRTLLEWPIGADRVE